MKAAESFAEVAQRYEAWRDTARAATVRQLGIPGLQLTAMSDHWAFLADTWKTFPAPYRPPAPWSWAAHWRVYKREIKNFNLCVHFHGTLAGLSLGRPTHSKTALRLEVVEGHPDPDHPLRGKVVPISLLCSELYARVIGARQVRLMEPHLPLIAYYRSFGYSLIPKAGAADRNYLYKNLDGGYGPG